MLWLLVRRMNKGDWGAAEELGKLGTPAALNALRDALVRPGEHTVRFRAAKYLGQAKDHASLEVLLAALGDANSNVRAEAAGALGEIGDAVAVEPLINALRDPDQWVCRCAAKALGQLGSPRALEPLAAVAPARGEHVAEAALTALLGFEGSQAACAIVSALKGIARKEHEESLRIHSSWSGPAPRLAEAISGLHGLDRRNWWLAAQLRLSGLGPAAVDALADSLDGSDWDRFALDRIERATEPGRAPEWSPSTVERLARDLDQVGDRTLQGLASAGRAEEVRPVAYGRLLSYLGNVWQGEQARGGTLYDDLAGVPSRVTGAAKQAVCPDYDPEWEGKVSPEKSEKAIEALYSLNIPFTTRVLEICAGRPYTWERHDPGSEITAAHDDKWSAPSLPQLAEDRLNQRRAGSGRPPAIAVQCACSALVVLPVERSGTTAQCSKCGAEVALPECGPEGYP